MQKHLAKVLVDGAPGGNQKQLRDFFMRLGGCAAVTHCDMCLYFYAYCNLSSILPEKIAKACSRQKDTAEINIPWSAYEEFTQYMKPYLRPRFQGVDRLEIFTDAANKYLSDHGVTGLEVDSLSADVSYNVFEETLVRQIDRDIPVPCLILRHKQKNLNDFSWHWFWFSGYKKTEERCLVETISYGQSHTFSLYELWRSEHKRKGGVILYNFV